MMRRDNISLEGTPRTGQFSIGTRDSVFGTLKLDGSNTTIRLQDKDFFIGTADLPNAYIKGTLHDLTRVSLLNCRIVEGPGHTTRGKERVHHARYSPGYVIFGDEYFAPGEKSVEEVSFYVDDANALFYDVGAFGRVMHPLSHINTIANANGLASKAAIGPEPEIYYYTGKREIFSVDTIIGKITASNNLTRAYPTPDGFHARNTVCVTITFKSATGFEECIASVYTLVRFLELCAGRPQRLLELYMFKPSGREFPTILEVFWPSRPWRVSDDGRAPHPADILVEPVNSPKEYASVLTNWLSRDATWRDPRLRFSAGFSHQNTYSTDRLIGAANMFDILPSTAVPADVSLSAAFVAARDQCKTLFREFPKTDERESVLRALGRLGRPTLKQKIRHRGQRVIDAIGGRVPDLFLATDLAVDCRNHYVHGSDSEIDYSTEGWLVIFLNETLEFVFAASDLIEAGWDIKGWCDSVSAISHPFSQYLSQYARNMQMLRELIERSTA